MSRSSLQRRRQLAGQGTPWDTQAFRWLSLVMVIRLDLSRSVMEVATKSTLSVAGGTTGDGEELLRLFLPRGSSASWPPLERISTEAAAVVSSSLSPQLTAIGLVVMFGCDPTCIGETVGSPWEPVEFEAERRSLEIPWAFS